jgi:hypothetical protein
MAFKGACKPQSDEIASSHYKNAKINEEKKEDGTGS